MACEVEKTPEKRGLFSFQVHNISLHKCHFQHIEKKNNN